MLILFLCGEFLLHIPCCPHICLGSLIYTSRAGCCCFSFFFFSFLSGQFLLHIPCWLHFYRVSFSYASHGGFPFLWGVSLTHPVLASFLCGSFLFHIFHAECFYVGSFCLFLFVCFYLGKFLLRTPYWFLFFIGVISLTHPVLALFLSWEFLLHIPCWLHIYLGSSSYTSHTGFPFLWGISLTHPVAGFIFKSGVLSGRFVLHI